MQEVFKRYGKVHNVYIARKRNTQGNRFGFVSFAGITNTMAFEKKLNTIYIGTQRVRCNVARYQKKDYNPNNTNATSKHSFTTNRDTQKPTIISNTTKPRASFADALKGKTPYHKPQSPTKINPILPPPPNNRTNSSIIAELHSIGSANLTQNLIIDEGFPDFSIKYLGGLHLLIIFNDQKRAEKALANKTLKTHFKTLKPWSNNIRIQDRVTWLSISGLPPHLWSTNVFSSIAENWGRVLIPEECSSRQFNRSLRKVCVLTTQMNFIKEMVHAPIGSESIPIRVSEADGEIDYGYTLTSSIFGGSNDDIEDADDSGEDSDVNSEEKDGPLGATNEDTFLENVGVPRNSDSGPHILSEEESTSNSRKQVKDKTNYLHECDTMLKTAPVNVCDTEGSQQAPSSPTTKKPIRKTNMIYRKQRNHSVPSSSSSEPLLHYTKKKRYASLRLIDPLNGIAPLPRKKKAATSTILNPNPGRFSQPSKPTSSPSPDAISDSLSLSGCCNQQILSNPINDSDTESLEVNKTMEVGNALGFNMVGKEKDVAQALGGIVAIWDTSKFHMTSSIIGNGFLALTGKWLSIDIDCLFIVVYAPQALNRKKKLWLDIEALVQS
ncbi:cytochrome P450 [Tanacetum coccineum]